MRKVINTGKTLVLEQRLGGLRNVWMLMIALVPMDQIF
jgi:hypothetical protein